jgi:hypothetical protein
MKYPSMLCAALLVAMPAVQAQTTPAPTQPATKSSAPPAVSGCERMKTHMVEMGDHMKRMGGTGMGCGHHGKHGMRDAKGHGTHHEMGDCMGRMSEMMKDMAPMAKECDRMTPEMSRRMERHEKEMQEWRKPPAK